MSSIIEKFEVTPNQQRVIGPVYDAPMDCFSTYEASVCGAIPIVVGDLNKLNNLDLD